jgi:hypothetical protein
MPLEGVTSREACMEPAVSVCRNMRPPLANAFSTATTAGRRSCRCCERLIEIMKAVGGRTNVRTLARDFHSSCPADRRTPFDGYRAYVAVSPAPFGERLTVQCEEHGADQRYTSCGSKKHTRLPKQRSGRYDVAGVIRNDGVAPTVARSSRDALRLAVGEQNELKAAVTSRRVTLFSRSIEPSVLGSSPRAGQWVYHEPGTSQTQRVWREVPSNQQARRCPSARYYNRLLRSRGGDNHICRCGNDPVLVLQ